MEIWRFSNHFSQINEQGNKSSSHSHLSLLYLIPAGQVSSATETFKLHPQTEDYLFNDRPSQAGLSVCPVFRYWIIWIVCNFQNEAGKSLY